MERDTLTPFMILQILTLFAVPKFGGGVGVFPSVRPRMPNIVKLCIQLTKMKHYNVITTHDEYPSSHMTKDITHSCLLECRNVKYVFHAQ